jgi:chromosome segregation ATPase
LRDEGYQLENSIRDKESEINRLREELYIYRPRVDEKKYTLSEFEKETKYVSETENHFNEQLNEIRVMKNKEVKAQSTLKTKITITEDEVKDFDQKVNDYYTTIDQLKDDIWKQRKAITELDDKHVFNNDHSEIERRVYFANDKKRALESELERNNRRVISLREIFTKLNKQRTEGEQEHDIENDEARVRALEAKIESLDKKIKTDLTTIDTLIDERTELNRKTDLLELKLRESRSHLDSLKNNTQVLEDDNKCLKGDLTKVAERDESE